MFTKQEIFAQLRELGVPQNRPVTIHTSLRKIGEVEGRGQGLLDALIEYVTAEGGLLCVPSHTHGNLYNDNIITLDFLHLNTNIGTFSSPRLVPRCPPVPLSVALHAAPHPHSGLHHCLAQSGFQT